MKHVLIAGLAAAWLLTAFTSEVAAQGDPAVYGAVPAVSEVQISPDGKTIAMLRSEGEVSAVVFVDLTQPGATPVGVKLGSGEARDLIWADNDHVLMLASDAGRMQVTTGLETIEFFRWFSVSKSRAKAVVLFGNEGRYYLASAGSVISTLPNDEEHVLIARITANTTGGSVGSRLGEGADRLSYDVFKVNLDSSDTNRLAGATPNTVDWLASTDGEVLARIDYDSGTQERILYMRILDSSTFKQAKAYAEGRGEDTAINFYGQSPDGSGLVASWSRLGVRSIILVDPATGDAMRTIYSNPDFDIDGVIYDYAKATAVAARFTDDLPRAFQFDPSDQKTQTALEKALNGGAPMIISESDDGAKMIVRVAYPDHPEQYFLYDQTAKSLSMIAATYPSIDGRAIARKEKFDYVASDGMSIRGYLTAAQGASKANMPLIVLPHGGPHARDDMAFDWWSFFYAANGYLVYQPNFRGSDGYGVAFRAAGDGEWGRKMQDDITEGVRKLIADDVADPNRICIVGASYGGYAALAGATLTPDLYACAVSVNGVSDLPALIGRSVKRYGVDEEYWDRTIGSRFRDAKALNEVSPVKIAERAGAPILLIHGRDDIVVPFSHSLRMHDALKAAGKPVELVELKGEDHWLSRSATRTATLAKSLEFINRHIGPAR